VEDEVAEKKTLAFKRKIKYLCCCQVVYDDKPFLHYSVVRLSLFFTI